MAETKDKLKCPHCNKEEAFNKTIWTEFDKEIELELVTKGDFRGLKELDEIRAEKRSEKRIKSIENRVSELEKRLMVAPRKEE